MQASESARNNNTQVLLQVEGLKKYFPIRKGLFKRVTGHIRAVDDVSLAVHCGETLGLVGESGCGKSTLGKLILRAIDPTEGIIHFWTADGKLAVHDMNQKSLRRYRKYAQLIFQDPYASLNPRMTVREIIGEPLIVNGVARGEALEDRVLELMQLVGLDSKHSRRYPHAFSGGQRQRIGIARSLALSPDLIIADEPVSALDVSIQAQILNLFQDLQKELGIAFLFISHDLSVVKYIADRVAVMYVGQIVEMTDRERLYTHPLHPYTEALMQSVPRVNPGGERTEYKLGGTVADPSNPPSGCYFHPRCRYAHDKCKTDPVPLTEVEPGHAVRCHRADQLELKGV